MSRFRRALAAAAMALATVGGGLLATAAAAAPAHAATPAGGHTTTSFTAVPAAQAAGGSSPKLICGDFCDPQPGPGVPATITCTITADTPYYDAPADYLIFTADTTCTGNVGQISMTQNVIHPGVNLTDSHVINNYYIAVTNDTTLCSPGQWAVSASANITPPAGWVIIAGHNPIVATSPTVTFDCGGSGGGGGGGGGGGCAIGTPSVPAQPAARQPNLISCP